MPYCPRCGVETDPSVNACPLCSTTIPPFKDLGPGEPTWPAGNHPASAHNLAKTYPTGPQRRLRALLVLVAVLATAALANLSSDLFTTGAFTWSRYPLLSLGYCFFLVSSLFSWYRRPLVWGGCWAVLTALFLALIDLASGRLSWSLDLGLPLVVVTFGLIFLGAGFLTWTRHRGYNVFAMAALFTTVELLTIDILVSHWVLGFWSLGWSLVTALVLLPVAFFFSFLHYALRCTPDLRRTFHF